MEIIFIKKHLTWLLGTWIILAAFGVYNNSLRPALPTTILETEKGLSFIEKTALSTVDTLLIRHVDGKAVSKIYELEDILDRKRIGDSCDIEFMDGESAAYILVARHSFGYFFVNAILGLLYFILATLILRRDTHTEEHYFAIACYLLGFVTAVSWPGIQPPEYLAGFVVIVYFLSYPQILTAFLLFSLHFPQPTFSNKFIRQQKRLFFIAGVIFSLMLNSAFFINFYHPSTNALKTYYYIYTAFRLYVILAFSLGIYFLFHDFQRIVDPVNRKKLDWVFAGIVLGIVPFLLLWSIPQIIGQPPLAGEWLVNSLMFFTPAGIFIAIVKYRLFDISLILSRSLIYGAAITVLIGVYLLVTGTLSLFVNQFMPAISPFFAVFIGILIGLVFNPLKNHIQKYVNQKFFRIRYDQFQSLQKLMQDQEMSHTEKEVFELLIHHFQKVVPLQHQQIMQKKPDGSWEVAAYLTENDPDIVCWLRDDVMDIQKDLLINRHNADWIEHGLVLSMSDFAERWVLLLPVGKKAVWLLGKKSAGNRFWKEDLDLTQQMAKAAAFHLENLQNLETAARESHARKKAQELSDWKSMLVMEVAHDIRSPLNTILWKLKNLQLSLSREMPANEGKIEEIQQQIERIQNFVQNLLVLAYQERGKLTIRNQPVLVQPALEAVIDSLQGIIRPRNLRVNIQCSAKTCIKGDAFLFQQIMANIIENAAKYSPVSSAINIRVSAPVPENNGLVQICVSDQGEGMDEETFHNLFVPFNNASGGNGKRDSFRLGLYITQQFVQLLRGHIEVESQKGLGTTVHIYLPDGE